MDPEFEFLGRREDKCRFLLEKRAQRKCVVTDPFDPNSQAQIS